MHYAKYIGRVGGLAVALGVGLGVGPTGIALAQGSEQGSGTSSNATSSTSDTTSSTTSTGTPAPTSTDSLGGDTTSGELADADEADDSALDIDDTDIDWSEDPGAEAPADELPAPGDDLGEPVDAEPVETEDDETNPDTSEPAGRSSSAHEPAAHSPDASLSVGGHIASDDSVSPPAALRAVTTLSTEPSAAFAADADVTTATNAQNPTIPETEQTSVITLMSLPEAAPAPQTPVSRLLSGVLSWLGVGPAATQAPLNAPTQSPLAWGLLAWVRRSFQDILTGVLPGPVAKPVETTAPVEDAAPEPAASENPVNVAPVIESVTSSQPDPSTGAVTYTVTVTDVDSPLDDLVVIVDTPGDGFVSTPTMTAPGTYTFTYTPSVLARILAGSTVAKDYDTFTIHVTDGNSQSSQSASVEVYGGSLITDPTNPFVGFGPQGMATYGNRLYVANAGSNGIAVIDTETGKVLRTITSKTKPQRLVVSPDGTRLYVANNGSNTVAVFDTETGAALGQVAVTKPFGLALNPDGTRLYVTSNSSNKVTVIDTQSGTAIATITVGSAPTAVATAGTQVYVANKNTGTVSVIDAATNNVVATVTVGSSPQGLALSADGKTLYVTNTGDGTVSVIDTTTAAIVANIAVGPSPNGIVLSPDGSVAYVNNGDHTVAVINTKTNTKVAGTIQAETGPLGQVAVSADGTRLYVSNSLGITIRTVPLIHIDPPPATENPNAGPLFEDFDGPAGSLANPNLFSFLLSGGGAGKLQMNTTDPRNASLDGEGNLVITALNEPYTFWGIPLYKYTSAYLMTKDKFEFTYGTVTARIKFPVGQGLHPAFWMVGSDVEEIGWPDSGEIDIFEIVNSPTYSGSGLHGPGNYAVVAPAAIDIDDGEFHDFWVKWEPNKITIGIDDQTTAVWTPEDLPPGVPWTYNDRSMYLILNIAIGGSGGAPDATTTFPAHMVVDWLKYEPLEQDVTV